MIIDWGKYPNFSKSEFDCKETSENEMKPDFLEKIQQLREIYGKPMVITSGYRSPRHSIEARKAQPWPHSSGRACDIRVGPGHDAYDLVRIAFKLGFTGIGISQKNGLARFVHLDMVPRKAIWSY
jgi:zinc D-Ala-D-Ala carboxypeptidase